MTAALLVAAPDSRAITAPNTIVLDSMVQHYQKVTFNHARHITTLGDCAICHHHTTGTLYEDNDRNCVRCHRTSPKVQIVACGGCHVREPFSVESVTNKDKHTYHLDKPGLKGAYHQSCLGCHRKMGAPTGCQDCHARTKAGDAMFNAGEFAPKNVAGKKGHH
jgi:hypothetical protein